MDRSIFINKYSKLRQHYDGEEYSCINIKDISYKAYLAYNRLFELCPRYNDNEIELWRLYDICQVRILMLELFYHHCLEHKLYKEF